MGNLPKGITRKQKILHAIATGDTSDLPEGITRKEKILHAIASGDTSNIPEGITREEQILQYIAENGGGSGGESERSLKTLLDFTKSAASLFSNLSDIETLPDGIIQKTDTSNVTNMDSMFRGCTSLTTIPELDTSNVTYMGSMFNGCTALTTIPELDTSNVTRMNDIFYNCTSLTTIPELDIRNVTSTSGTYGMFDGCTALTECLLKNIKEELSLSSSPLLTLNSLIHLIKELCNTGSSKTLTLGSTNLAKLSDTYVKLVTITDEMRAEDDLIDEKLPFEVCESTDDGAMLIVSYVTKKNWTLA